MSSSDTSPRSEDAGLPHSPADRGGYDAYFPEAAVPLPAPSGDGAETAVLPYPRRAPAHRAERRQAAGRDFACASPGEPPLGSP
ncbi:hypothetical protein AB0M39_30145 [Streptomyces sp. NPDC051907]|uniref:hypothetical protein n=1 Tax=Streptomyces sp. NPDC051907 TaxID=3155284 RepID=UPI00344A9A10